MLGDCCECGGGSAVTQGWMRDFGYVYGQQPRNDGGTGIPFGWRCPVDENRGTTPQKRGPDDGWTRPMNWNTCPGGGDEYVHIENEFSIAVPYKGNYLVTVHWQDVGGTQAMEVAVENVRLIGQKHAVADHIKYGVSELAMVEVIDGNLTITANLTGRAKISWVSVEKISDGGSAPVGNDRVWLPTTDEAYYELELEEKQTPVGLVVVDLPGNDMMTPQFEPYGASFALPKMFHGHDDDNRQEWFYNPPGDSVPRSMAIW